MDQDPKFSRKLRLIRKSETCETIVPNVEVKPPIELKSAMARQLTNFADDLDKQIAALLSS